PLPGTCVGQVGARKVRRGAPRGRGAICSSKPCHHKITIRGPWLPYALAGKIAVRALATRAFLTCTTTRSIAIGRTCRGGGEENGGGIAMAGDRRLGKSRLSEWEIIGPPNMRGECWRGVQPVEVATANGCLHPEA